uniref:Uncharacterized protein n=1 Tax=Glossina brevipalpis TaxID=37001 RepID=A0A1A9WJH8_9MUSC
MLHLVQSGKNHSKAISVPEGLPELLSDITQEVIRWQPSTECMCEFIIDYLRSVIATREKLRGKSFWRSYKIFRFPELLFTVSKMIIDRALRKVDEIMADLCICDIAKEKSEQMSIVMEKCFKRFLAKRRCEKDKQDEVLRFGEIDILDELIKKCKFTDLELKKTRTFIEAAYNRFVDMYLKAQKDVDPTESLYQYLHERELQRLKERKENEAATKIQAYFRGYSVRKSLYDLKQSSSWWVRVTVVLTKEQQRPSFEVARADERSVILRNLEEPKMLRTYRPRFVDVIDECESISNVSMTARLPEQFRRRRTTKQGISLWSLPEPITEEERFIKRTYKIPSGTMMDTFAKSEDKEYYENDDMYNADIEDEFEA